MANMKIGLIGLVHDEAKKDLWGTLQRVAAIGYQGVESPGYLLNGSAVENVRRFNELGLEAVATGASREALEKDLGRVIDTARALKTKNVICYWGPCESKDQLLRDADLYNRAGEALAAAGLRQCYHNHEHEFQHAFNGLYALDILAEHTDPRFLSFEIDVAWVTFGGEDPVKVLRRFAGRVPIIHVKDFWGLDDRSKFTAVGTGVVNIEGALRAARETGVEWAVVEQDALRTLDAFDTITVSYLNLKERGLI